MHPILARRSRLILYLLAWLPVAAALASLLAPPDRAQPLPALALALAAAAVYASVCLSAYYLCRSLPIGPSAWWRLLLVPVLAAAISASLWLALLQGLAAMLGMKGLAGNWPYAFALGAGCYLISVVIHYLLMTVEASAIAAREASEARALAAAAELRALKAQINPHFLFNSLNSISALTTADPARAREMCVLLADFLRKGLALADAAAIPLARELDLTHNFLAIEKVRFGDRLRLEESLGEDCGACLVPALILQPLVENAVKHGVAHLLAGGTIRIAARNSGARLHLVIENDFDPDSVSLSKRGVGLENARRRLAALYGDQAALAARPAGTVYRVELDLPVQTGRQA